MEIRQEIMRCDLGDLELEAWLRARNEGRIVWVTKDGRKIPIKDMSDEHLHNAINHVARQQALMDIAFDFEG